jgi:hypothetical protein
MTLNLSTVLAYMCGVEVQELQLTLFSAYATTHAKVAEPACGTTPSAAATLNGEGRKDGVTTIITTTTSATTTTAATATTTPITNKPPQSAGWLWRVRRAFVASALAKKEAVTTITPPTTQSKASTRGRSGNGVYSGSSPVTSLSRGTALVSLTEVVAQALPCLGCCCCTSAIASAPTSPVALAEKGRWGVPRWPACTITIDAAVAAADRSSGKEGGEALSLDADGAEVSHVGDNISLRWGSERETRYDDVAAISSTSTTATFPFSDLGGGGAAQPTSDSLAQLVVHVHCKRGRSESIAPALSSLLSSRGVAVLCDPAPPTLSALPSCVPPPPSLLLPDAVRLRHVPPSRLTTPTSYHSTATSSTPVAADSADEPTVEVLLVAVEALPELFETRRQGLILFKDIILRLYATKKAGTVVRREGTARDFTASGPPELPSLRWRCELWTPPAEGKAGQPAPPTPSSSAAEAWRDDVVCRTVVQKGHFSVYTRNKSAVTPPSTALGVGLSVPVATAAAVAELLSSAIERRFINCDEPAFAKAARAPSLVLHAPLDDFEAKVRTFCQWWADMEHLARKLMQPANEGSLFTALPSPAVSGTAMHTAGANDVCSSSKAGDTVEDVAWMQHTVEQLLLWWAAKSVRVVSPASLLQPTQPLLRPLPSGATPLFGAIVIPAHVRCALPVAVVAESSDDTSSPSPTLSQLPSLTLCFVNPRGTYVYQYDLEALNVLCRAVHTLHAVVYVVDAEQKAALLAWMRCFVRPYTPTQPQPTTAAVPATAAVAAASGSVPSTQPPLSIPPSSTTLCANPGGPSGGRASATTTATSTTAITNTTPTTAATITTTGAAAAAMTSSIPAAATGVVYIEYPYDALSEVEASCLCLEDYAYERHRRALAGREGGDSEGKEERVPDTVAAAQATCQQQAPVSSASPFSSSCIVKKAHTGVVPSPAWCHGARVLACEDLLGRRRLDVFTSLLKRSLQPQIGQQSLANPATSIDPTLAAGGAVAASSQQAQPPPTPPLTLNPVPASFLSYLLRRVDDGGVEEVEQLSATIMEMGRRISGG